MQYSSSVDSSYQTPVRRNRRWYPYTPYVAQLPEIMTSLSFVDPAASTTSVGAESPVPVITLVVHTPADGKIIIGPVVENSGVYFNSRYGTYQVKYNKLGKICWKTGFRSKEEAVRFKQSTK